MTVRVEASSGRGACLTIVSIVCWRWARVDWTNKAKHAPVLAFLVCGVRPSVSMSRASLLLFTSLAHGHPCHHSGIAIPIPVRFPTNPVWAFQLSRSQISTTANLRLNLLLRSRCQIREADGQIRFADFVVSSTHGCVENGPGNLGMDQKRPFIFPFPNRLRNALPRPTAALATDGRFDRLIGALSLASVFFRDPS